MEVLVIDRAERPRDETGGGLRMSVSIVSRRVLPIALLSLTALACSSPYRDVGHYRIAAAGDGVFGMMCQTRQEFYFQPLEPKDAVQTYLGTCGTPGFITDQAHLPADPSCFAIAEDGKAMVYLHQPEMCGAGDKAKKKAGGIYRHSEKEGDRLLYPASDLNQVWGGEAVGAGAMRIRWLGRTPSRGGAACPQSLVIQADGTERVEGRPDAGAIQCRR